MNYLRITKLQEAVSDALVTVINERAGGRGEGAGELAKQRMCELLLGKKAYGGDKMPASVDEIAKATRAEQRAGDFATKNVELDAENKTLMQTLQQAQRDIEKLQNENAAQLKEIEKLRQQGTALRAKVQAMAPSSSGAYAPPYQQSAPGHVPKTTSGGQDATQQLRRLMGLLFDRLDGAERAGSLRKTRILALRRTIEQACGGPSASALEKDSFGAFGTALLRLTEEGHMYARDEFVNFLSQASIWQAGFKEKVIEIFNEIIENAEILKGFLEKVDAEERLMTGHQGFQQMMSRMCDEVLCKGEYSDPNSIEKPRLKALIATLHEANAEIDVPESKDALRAFVRHLQRMSEEKRVWTKDEWKQYEPPADAFTPREQDYFVEDIMTILDGDDACKGWQTLMAKGMKQSS
jgi:hypothetical protein